MADAVQYQKDQDARSFMKSKLAKARVAISNRIHRNERQASTEEQSLLAAYKEAAINLGKYVAKTGITPLSLDGAVGVPVVSANMFTDKVVGTREEQQASAAAFREKVTNDLKALDAIEEELDIAFYTQQSGESTAGAVQKALKALTELGEG
jgi:hypothetical protein